jgi:hypothetical protein
MTQSGNFWIYPRKAEVGLPFSEPDRVMTLRRKKKKKKKYIKF